MTPQAARRWLLCYGVAVVGISFIHHAGALAALLAMAVMLAGPQRIPLLRRTLLAILAFNLTVSAGYALISVWQGRFAADTLLLLNLRVLVLVFLGFWAVHRIDLLAALSAWPLASLVVTLAIGQIKTFERVLADFRLAFASRNPLHPRWNDRARHAAAQAQTLLDKSFAAAGESALALRSRGAFEE